MDEPWLMFSLITALSMICYGWLSKKMANAGLGAIRIYELMRTLRSDDALNQIPMGHGWHDSYGWLRRTDLDEAYAGFMYETPDGHLIRTIDARHERGMYLDKYVVKDTGEIVFQISSTPKIYSRERNKI